MSVCNNCNIVYRANDSLEWKIITSVSGTPTALSYIHQGANQGTNTANWSAGLQGNLPSGEIARFNNKIWSDGIQSGQDEIIEFTLNSNCDGLELSKLMPVSMPGWTILGSIIGLSAKNANTLIGVCLATQSGGGSQWVVIELDVSGATALGTFQFASPFSAMAATLIYLKIIGYLHV